MPAEPSRAKLKRRSSRKDGDDTLRFDGGHAREIELKRNRGEISCAECRRLKIKCDKQIPCQSCQRRGCAALCPNGSLSTGQGTRFVLAATEHLHRRIARMIDRIRQLEDALSVLQAKSSNEPHPLLREDLLSANIDHEEEALPMGIDDGPPTVAPTEVIDTFGTLSISDHGISRFFGPTGGSESLLMADNPSTNPQSSPSSTRTQSTISPRGSNSPSLNPSLTYFSHSFPFTPMGPADSVQQLVASHLPPHPRATALAETYLEQAAWLFRGVSRAQLVDEMIPAFYPGETESNTPREASVPEDYSGPHDLALLFCIFAVGALVDLNQEPSNAEAEHYHQIARAAVCLQPILEKPSLVTIQTLHLLSIYNAMSGNEVGGGESSMETTWSLITLAANLSQAIGLHRDSARWGLSPKMVERRRILFWDLFLADAWQSLNTGRPPCFSLAYIDCRFPQEHDEHGNPKGEDDEPGFESWGFRFASTCVADVAARTLTAEAPSYAVIMELDRKVREFPISRDAAAIAASSNGSVREEPSEEVSIARSMQMAVMSHSREVILLYIHRSFFAQAIIEHPPNPLRSAYAPSFLAAYRASSTILNCIRDQFAVQPNLCARFWSMWTFAFSAAIVFGTVVTRGPHSPLASSAMSELDQACLLFSKAATHSRRAAKALPILTRLSEKAHATLSAAQSDPTSGTMLNGSLWNVKQEASGPAMTHETDENDELAIFAGRTRFVSSAKPRHSQSPASAAQGAISTSHGYAAPPPPKHHHQQQQTEAFTQAPSASFEHMNNSRWQGDQAQIHSQLPPHRNLPPQQQQQQYVPVSASVSDVRTHASVAPDRYSVDTHYDQQAPMHSVSAPDPNPSTVNMSYEWNQGHASAGHPHRTSMSQPQPPQMSYPLTQSGETYQHQQQLQHQQAPQQFYLPTSYSTRVMPSAPSLALADLGLASRDSRLDERWTSFMQDSGMLEDIGYRRR